MNEMKKVFPRYEKDGRVGTERSSVFFSFSTVGLNFD